MACGNQRFTNICFLLLLSTHRSLPTSVHTSTFPCPSMPDPKTPSSAGHQIDNLIQRLLADCGLQYSRREEKWSPSRRDPNSLQDKIHGCIQYLYYRKGPARGALDHAIKQFEAHAPSIKSEWRFKPLSDPAVVHIGSDPSTSAPRKDFLHKRGDLSHTAVRELLESLYHQLSIVADRVRIGEPFDGSNETMKPTEIGNRESLPETLLGKMVLYVSTPRD